jgi:vacuolar-type H+-ATPase subunit H
MLRSEIYFAIWEIEHDLLQRCAWCERMHGGGPEHCQNPAQNVNDLRVARAHLFEDLHRKDEEILEDWNRRADNYPREQQHHEQRETDRARDEARAKAERRPSNRGNTPKAGKRTRGGAIRTPGLYD